MVGIDIFVASCKSFLLTIPCSEIFNKILFILSFILSSSAEIISSPINTVFFLYTNNDVSSANVIKVIGESTDSMVYLVGIPSFLEFYAVGLYLALAQKVFYIYRNRHRANVIFQINLAKHTKNNITSRLFRHKVI